MRCLTFLALSLLLFSPENARADLGDCADPAYLSRFPEAPAASSINCVEHFRVVVGTSAGPRQIRGISDISAGWAVPPTLLSGIERGAQAAADTLPSIGGFALDDVTILILDDLHDFDAERRILAMADGRGGDGGGRSGECLITLYGLAASTDPAQIATTTAHEIFHCVQYATLTSGQMGSYTSGGAWWIEGSAEYFAALAVEGSEPHTDRSDEFDANVHDGTPLDQLNHEAMVFFSWYGQTQGSGDLTRFMAAMASSGGSSAQHAAMRAVLSDDKWLSFAQAYVDSDIAHPQGGALGINAKPRETIMVSRPGVKRVTLDPFSLHYVKVQYECGTWGNEVEPSDANMALRRDSDRDWGQWPEEVDLREGDPGDYRFVALHTDTGAVTVTNDIERRRACQPCGPTDKVDACLNGTWQMTAGGPIEWMRSHGLPITNVSDGPRIISLHSDGIYSTKPFSISFRVEGDDHVGEADGGAAAAYGRWSAKDGMFYICQDAGGVAGNVTVHSRSGSHTQPVSQRGGGMLEMTYSCSEGTLQTQTPIPGMSPMSTTYSKIAEEPESP